MRSARRPVVPWLAVRLAASLVLLAGCGERPSGTTEPGPPARLAFEAGDGQSAAAGGEVAVQPTVAVLGAAGRRMAGVAVGFAASGDGRVATATVLTDGAGVARSAWTLGTRAGTDTLTATVPGLAPARLVARTVPGPAARMVATAGEGQTAAPGGAVAVPPAVQVTDRFGNPVARVPVRFAGTTGGGSVSGSEALTDSSGSATAGEWTLGAAGVNTTTASAAGDLAVTFTALALARSADLDVIVLRPTPAEMVGDTLMLAVAVASRYALASVQATVASTTMDLAYSASARHFVAAVPLRGVPRDTVSVLVTARDVNSARTDAIVRVVHDRPPALVVTEPAAGTVARPTVAVAATCEDDDPAGCRRILVEAGTAGGTVFRRLAEGAARVDGSVSLAEFEGRQVTLRISALDTRDQATRVERRVFVESGAALREVVTTDGEVLDLRGDRVLYRDAAGRAVLRAVVSGAGQPFSAGAAEARALYGFVTPVGAIVAASRADGDGEPSIASARVLELRGGSLVERGTLNAATSLQVADGYALFSTGATLTRVDLRSGVATTISNAAGNTQNAIAPNGDVAFWTTDYRIARYRDGQAAPLAPQDGAGLWSTYPVTDGVHVVYRRHTPCCRPDAKYAVVLHDGTAERELAPARPREPYPGLDYAVNAGWTAFTKPDLAGVLQVWLRAAGGEQRQLSLFGTDSRIEAVGDDGSVIFRNEGGAGPPRRYLAAPGHPPQDVMSGAFGTIAWRDGRFVALIGRSAFAITP